MDKITNIMVYVNRRVTKNLKYSNGKMFTTKIKGLGQVKVSTGSFILSRDIEYGLDGHLNLRHIVENITEPTQEELDYLEIVYGEDTVKLYKVGLEYYENT